MGIYRINQPLVIQGLASERNQELTLTESRKTGCRTIGGNHGDLHFKGYSLNEDKGTTTLYAPILSSSLELSVEEAFQIASEVLAEAVAVIGTEAVE